LLSLSEIQDDIKDHRELIRREMPKLHLDLLNRDGFYSRPPMRLHHICGAETPAFGRGEEAPLLLSGSAETGRMAY
jgi:hypothetical protein